MSHIWYIFLTFISVVNSSVLQLEQKSDLPNLRIVGGRPASPLNTKHQVSLRLKSREKEYGFGYGHLCGGSLIASDLVLTAAHCVFLENSNTLRSAKELVVVMGTMNITVQTTDTLVYSVKNVIVHKRYSAVTVRNDIALLRLSEKVPVNHKTVKPIELTSQETNVGTKCEITGWGAMKNEGSGVYYLQTADILIQEMDVCNSSVSYNGKLKAGMLCAGIYEGGIDSCQGDSGGPMVCNGVLTGVISWGFKCALPRYPGIYSSVYYYRDWIETNSSINLISSLLMTLLCFIMTLLFN